MLFTSGTTGKPKGLVVQHGSLSSYIAHTNRYLELKCADVVLQSTPFTFDASVQLLWCPVTVGACVAIAKPGAALDPYYVQALIWQHGVSFVDMVPSVLSMYLDTVGNELPFWVRSAFVLGEACKPGLAHRITTSNMHVAFTNRYGPAEATIASHGYPSGLVTCRSRHGSRQLRR